MSAFDKPITIQILDEETETWKDLFTKPLHARVNKSSGSEYLDAGASRSRETRVFEVRYFKELEPIALNTQIYRLIYRNAVYNITDYDDYMEMHQTVKLLGVAC